MADTPKTLQDAIRYYSDEQICIDTVGRLRWPNGPECPACGHKKHYYLATQKRWKCKECHKQFTVKLGTIFEDLSRLSWKWRKRSSVKIAERTYEKRAQALHC